MRRERLRATVDGSVAYELDPEELMEVAETERAPALAATSPRSSHPGGRRGEPRRGEVVLALPPSPDDRGVGRSRYEAVVDGWRFEVVVEPAARAALRERARRAGEAQRPSSRQVVRAQIPGRVVTVFVSAGDRVEAGGRLVSVEAMKMENEVRAPRAGTIERVAVAGGARVELGDELVVIE